MLLTNARPPDKDRPRKSKGKQVIKWIETHCVGSVGKWAKQPARLLPWQKLFIMHLFEETEEGRRRYRWALLGLPKKNGKTELAAWLALYFLIGDGEPSPWIAVAASADHQADLVFGAARRCAEWSPTLRHITECYDKEITVPSIPGAKLVRVAASSGTNDGPSWHVVICDEFHEWKGKKGQDTHTVLTNGVGAREQPLILQITTAGFDVDGTICGQHYLLGRDLVADPDIDPTYLFWWYEADLRPREDGTVPDYRDPAVWMDANPSWGLTLPDPEAYLRDQVTKKTEAEFKRYFLNVWVEAEDLWLPAGAWEACRVLEAESSGLATDEEGNLALDPSLPLFVGSDGALKRDSFATVAVQWQKDSEGRERLVTKAWIWENPFPVGHHARSSWKLNLGEPVGHWRELRDQFPEPALEGEPGPAFGYDPRFLEYAAQTAAEEGLNMVEFPQTDARMCPASELLYTVIMERVLAHDGDPQFQKQVMSSVQKMKENGWRITRPTGTRRHNDAGIALAMATALAHAAQEEDEVPEIY